MKFSLVQVSRGVAAMLVIMHHLIANCTNHLNYVAFNNFFNFGFLGVDFFFVLSGFIITYIHFNDLQNRKSNSVSLFFKKRFIRIYPIYWILAIVIMGIYIKSTPVFMKEVGLEMNFKSLDTLKFLAKSFLLIPDETTRLVGVAWSLSYELLFYIIFGISIVVGLKLAKAIAIFWILLVVLFAIFPLDNEYLRFFLNVMVLEFLMGCLVGYIIRKQINIDFKYLFISLACLFIAFFKDFHMEGLVYHRNLYNVFLIGAVFSIITYSIVRFDQLNQYIKYPILLTLVGDASYSIYLSHNMFLSGLTRTYARLNPNFLSTGYLALVAIAIFIITIIVGIVIHLLIEKRLLNFINNKFLYEKNS